MSLRKRLDALREASAAKIPADKKAVMHRATEDLRSSGILDTMLSVGAQAPQFTLPASDGTTISLEDELAKGPMVLTFFRGSW